jgi:hypothetical protein
VHIKNADDKHFILQRSSYQFTIWWESLPVNVVQRKVTLKLCTMSVVKQGDY